MTAGQTRSQLRQLNEANLLVTLNFALASLHSGPMLGVMIRRILLACALTSAATAPGIAADPRGRLQAACFPAETLAGDPAERLRVKLERPSVLSVPAGIGTPLPPVAEHLHGVIRRVELPPGSKKLVALTFDFCEQSQELAGYDGAIIDVLRREGVKATLFMGGRWMASHPARTGQLLADPLFQFGTHGLAHRNTRGLTGADLQREIVAPNAVYAQARAKLAAYQCALPHGAAFQAIPPAPNLFRFPFGACAPEGLATANEAGLLAIQWDVSTGDPAPTATAQDIARAMTERARPGSIIIAHANGRGQQTAAALPIAIAGLRARGFQFVTVGELLAAGRPVVVPTCYDAKPGDTDKYDALLARPAVPQHLPWTTHILFN